MSILLPTNLQQCPSSSLSPSTPLLSPSPSSASAVSFLGTRRRCLRFVTSSVASTQSPVENGSAPAPAAAVVERDQIRLGLPSKGRMAADAIDLLKDCQLSVKQVNPRQYVAQIPQLPNTEVWFQRPKDIVRKLLSGDLDLGIVGLDTLSEYGQGNEDLIVVHEALNFGDCHLSIAIPNYGIFENINSLKELAQMPQWSEERPLRVATGFTYLGPKFMKENGIKHVAFSTADGALEAAPAMGIADAILDLVSSGTTLKENNLKEIDGGVVLESQAVLVASRRALTDRKGALNTVHEILERLEAHLKADGQFTVVANMRGNSAEEVAERQEDEDDDDEDSDSDDESQDEASTTPVIQVRRVAHHGCVNRIRAMPQNPHICVSWADSGHVQVWDMSSHLNALAESETEGKDGTSPALNQAPLVNFSGHKDEGYAIDWSPATAGRLLSGDCMSMIHLWEPASGSWTVDPIPLAGHTASVEDLQWSPAEANVFASCSVDGTIALWDVRVGKTPALSFKAHNADVNVISWNRLASCMLASGSDDGAFSIHDLRVIKEGDAKVAHFEYHKHPITSIEWSAHESSTLAVSSGDNQLTIWDLSLEKDEEEEAEFKAQTKEQVNTPQDLPPQLLFVHQGQKDLKELHWHNQIPGMIISTAEDGFNILMPYNIQNTLPDLAA